MVKGVKICQTLSAFPPVISGGLALSGFISKSLSYYSGVVMGTTGKYNPNYLLNDFKNLHI
jgi:hypothetical protein